MQAASSRLAQAARIVRGIERNGLAVGVVLDAWGNLEAVDKDSPRFAALLGSASVSSRVVGVFGPGVTVAQLLAEAGA